MKNLTDADLLFRKLVESVDGNQRAAAAVLGVSQVAVYKRLRTTKHVVWWLAFKERRAKRRKREREQRYYQKKKAERLDAQQRLGEDPTVALARDLLNGLL